MDGCQDENLSLFFLRKKSGPPGRKVTHLILQNKMSRGDPWDALRSFYSKKIKWVTLRPGGPLFCAKKAATDFRLDNRP
jgi:hypothetical protein